MLFFCFVFTLEHSARNDFVDLKNVARASVDIAVSSRWVKFPFCVNCPFNYAIKARLLLHLLPPGPHKDDRTHHPRRQKETEREREGKSCGQGEWEGDGDKFSGSNKKQTSPSPPLCRRGTKFPCVHGLPPSFSCHYHLPRCPTCSGSAHTHSSHGECASETSDPHAGQLPPMVDQKSQST